MVYRIRLDPMSFDYISDSIGEILGYTPGEFYEDPSLGARIVVAEDRWKLTRAIARPRDLPDTAISIRWRHREGGEVRTTHWIWSMPRAGDEVEAIHGLAIPGDAPPSAPCPGPLAWANHEVVCDETGTPVDLRYLATCERFERLTGVEGSEVLGKSVWEAFPNLERSWIDNLGKVGLSRRSELIELLDDGFGHRFRLHAFSVRTGELQALFHEV